MLLIVGWAYIEPQSQGVSTAGRFRLTDPAGVEIATQIATGLAATHGIEGTWAWGDHLHNKNSPHACH